MEKRIAIWSYWLGVLSTVLTIVLRGLAAFGVFPILAPSSGASVSYYTFLRGGVLLLVLSIASSLLTGSRRKIPNMARARLKPCFCSHQPVPKV